MIEIEELPVSRAAEFWERHIRYLIDDGIVTDGEDVEYFQSGEYRDTLEAYMVREQDRHHMVYFAEGGTPVGAAQYTIYQGEDGKCFILDFWVFPEYRGNGAGHRCYECLAEYARRDGARYYEINCERENAMRFWRSLGFVENGVDEYGMKLFIKR